MKREHALSRHLAYARQRGGERIQGYLTLSEKDSVYQFGEGSPYEESILSLEVKKYFSEMAGEQAVELEPEVRQESLLQRVFDVFRLDAFEQMCIEMALLAELNPTFEKFIIFSNNDWNNGHLTMDLAIRLYSGQREAAVDFYRYFAEDSLLLRFFFQFLEQEGKGRSRWGLKLRNSFFELMFSQTGSGLSVFPFIRWQEGNATCDDNELFRHMDNMLEAGTDAIYLYGAKNIGKRKMLGQYASKKGRDICFMDIVQYTQTAEKRPWKMTSEEIADNLYMEAKLRQAFICIHTCDRDFLDKKYNRRLLLQFIDRFRGDVQLFVVGNRQGLLEPEWELWEFSLDSDVYWDSSKCWQAAAQPYSLEEAVNLELFAATYHFTPAQLERIFQNAEKKRTFEKRDSISTEDVKESCISETGSVYNHQITVVNTEYQWEDLVLPDKQKGLLKSACNRVRYRQQIYDEWGFRQKMPYGRGVSMLFSGPPGTGKTMSAGIVANYLGTVLYRVNLAAVMSKYIGETEKNLDTAFEIAAKGQGVLFFDEADVLFSKRTEVKSSNDKHSNLEAAYLLQKMEEYEGVVILATNYMQNMDEAFKRRIPFLIEFPFPDVEYRRMLWESVFPTEVEMEEQPDYDFLAGQFELSGSQIKNIALQAAFFAADENRGISMEYVIKALTLELGKTGKRISKEELRQYSVYSENK